MYENSDGKQETRLTPLPKNDPFVKDTQRVLLEKTQLQQYADLVSDPPSDEDKKKLLYAILISSNILNNKGLLDFITGHIERLVCFLTCQEPVELSHTLPHAPRYTQGPNRWCVYQGILDLVTDMNDKKQLKNHSLNKCTEKNVLPASPDIHHKIEIYGDHLFLLPEMDCLKKCIRVVEGVATKRARDGTFGDIKSIFELLPLDEWKQETEAKNPFDTTSFEDIYAIKEPMFGKEFAVYNYQLLALQSFDFTYKPISRAGVRGFFATMR